jgi:catechol 2,3-dioxygenase-like lactoylglutathione lyase family enzyme
MKFRLWFGLWPAAIPVVAQLPAPNAAGVSAGHDILSFHDTDAANKFWNALDAPAELGPLKMTKFPGVRFLMGMDDVKVRITEDRSLSTSGALDKIAADQIKMVVPDVAAAQAWYEKWFGAKLVKHGNETVGEIPGSNILFAKATGPVTGTKGRTFDRIGLEVKNVEQVCRDLEASGIKLDGAYRKATAMNLAVCVLTDPWGTFIEISEGLAAVR